MTPKQTLLLLLLLSSCFGPLSRGNSGVFSVLRTCDRASEDRLMCCVAIRQQRRGGEGEAG